MTQSSHLPDAMIRISARPADSLGKILHQIRDDAEGGSKTLEDRGLDDICCGAFVRIWPIASKCGNAAFRPLY